MATIFTRIAKGDVVEARVPSGILKFKILDISL